LASATCLTRKPANGLTKTFDLIVVGGGAAGATCASRLAEQNPALSIALLEAGPSDRHPLVRVPFGLIWLMGSRRDWAYRTVPQESLGGRCVSVPRGKMLGGSASMNSMVWFRGRTDDYDHWGPGWGWDDVRPHFEAVEEQMRPAPLRDPHPLSTALGRVHGGPPTPEVVSSGPFIVNIENGQHRSPVDAFLRGTNVHVLKNCSVRKLMFTEGRVQGVQTGGGEQIKARAGVVLSAGTIGTPQILMQSGLGPAEMLQNAGIAVQRDIPGVGANLHDHPAVAVHHEGRGSGRGLTLGQLPLWVAAPFQWLASGRGPLASNTVEAGGFLAGKDGGAPRFQVHFVPTRIGFGKRAIGLGAGYYADVCLMQPRSRGRMTLGANGVVQIDPGLLSDPDDRVELREGLCALRALLRAAPFGPRSAPEVFPATGDDTVAVDAHIDARLGTAYHPVGTCAIGAVLGHDLAFHGIHGLWLADASVMPRITSANTNAPSIMIGHRAARLITQQLKAQ